MELKNLLEFLYTVRSNFTRIQIEWAYWYYEDMMNFILKRWADQHPMGSVAILKSQSSSTKANQGEKRSYHRRVWWQKPSCWREEQRSDAQ